MAYVIFCVRLLLPLLSILIFCPHIDPKHQPILLLRVENQLSYSCKVMNKVIVSFKSILVITVSESRLGDARL
jgi:hypothetical protein